MAQPTINDACAAAAVAVATISGLRAIGYVDDTINPPQAQIYTRPYDPRMVLGNSKRTFLLGVRVFVRRTDPRSAQLALRLYMEPTGSNSITAAIENEALWPVTVDYAEVTFIGQPSEIETAAEIYLAVDFDVDVVW
jgi:hypothetical protein